MTIKKMALVGTGVMGMGIAQIAAQAGLEVRLYDAKPGAAKQGLIQLEATLKKLAAKGKISEQDLSNTLSQFILLERIEEISGVDLVIEAVSENLEIKQNLFKQLEAIVDTDVILASNTSSLIVTEIAAVCQYQQRVAGYHFFNPVPLMKIVEVIPGLATAESTITALLELAQRMGHFGVRAKDTPGFIVNNIGRAFTTEALKVLGDGVTTVSEIDRILRDGVGFRMGPFELFDLTALDVSHPAMVATYNQFYHETRYRPHPITSQMVAGKRFGRKVGEGFYKYVEGVKTNEAPAQAIPSVFEFKAVWVKADLQKDADILIRYLNKRGITVDTAAQPAVDSLILLATYGEDTTTAALRFKVAASRCISIDMLTDFNKHRTLMPSIVTTKTYIDQAHAIFAKDGHGVSVIAESVGFVAQRVLAMVVNLACDVAQQKIATATDIDKSVKLALGYPFGPISWGDHLGADLILLISQRIHAITGDQRYRPSLWLQRRAGLNLSLLHASDI